MPLRRFKFYSMVHFLDTELLVLSFFFFLPNDPHCLQLKSRYKMLLILKTLHTLPRKVYLSQFAFMNTFIFAFVKGLFMNNYLYTKSIFINQIISYMD